MGMFLCYVWVLTPVSIAEFDDWRIVVFCIALVACGIAAILESIRHFKVIQKQEREKQERDKSLQQKPAQSRIREPHE